MRVRLMGFFNGTGKSHCAGRSNDDGNVFFGERECRLQPTLLAWRIFQPTRFPVRKDQMSPTELAVNNHLFRSWGYGFRSVRGAFPVRAGENNLFYNSSIIQELDGLLVFSMFPHERKEPDPALANPEICRGECHS